MSLRDRILAATSAFQPTAVEVPDLGGTVYVRPISVGGLARSQQAMGEDRARGLVLMLIDCVCDEKGARLFTSKDVDAVADLPMKATETLLKAINDVSSLSPKAVEIAEGN